MDKPSGSFVSWNNTLCNPLAPAMEQSRSAWDDGYESGRLAEREACAKVCDAAHERFKELWNKFDYPEDEGRMNAASQCAAAIRARGQE